MDILVVVLLLLVCLVMGLKLFKKTENGDSRKTPLTSGYIQKGNDTLHFTDV